MNYELAEGEISERLKSNLELCEISDIIILPDNMEAYRTPVTKGLVTVVFMSEKFDHNQSMGVISQHSTAVFNISIRARKLRGTRGVYAISEMVKETLLGFSPSDCGMLSLGEQSFAEYENDIWEHSVIFSCRTLRSQVVE